MVQNAGRIDLNEEVRKLARLIRKAIRCILLPVIYSWTLYSVHFRPLAVYKPFERTFQFKCKLSNRLYQAAHWFVSTICGRLSVGLLTLSTPFLHVQPQLVETVWDIKLTFALTNLHANQSEEAAVTTSITAAVYRRSEWLALKLEIEMQTVDLSMIDYLVLSLVLPLVLYLVLSLHFYLLSSLSLSSSPSPPADIADLERVRLRFGTRSPLVRHSTLSIRALNFCLRW